MTDLDRADECLTRARQVEGTANAVLYWLLRAFESQQKHLRSSTPTAPARTEEAFAPARCALCTGPLVAVAHNRPEAEGLRFFAPCSCQGAKSPDAEENETTQRGTMVLPSKRRVLWESGPVPIGEADARALTGELAELREKVRAYEARGRAVERCPECGGLGVVYEAPGDFGHSCPLCNSGG